MNLKNILLFILVSVIFLSMALTPDGSYDSPEMTKKINSFIAYSQEISGSEITIKMNPIKGGEFLMGSNNHKEDEKPQTTFCLSYKIRIAYCSLRSPINIRSIMISIIGIEFKPN